MALSSFSAVVGTKEEEKRMMNDDEGRDVL